MPFSAPCPGSLSVRLAMVHRAGAHALSPRQMASVSRTRGPCVGLWSCVAAAHRREVAARARTNARAGSMRRRARSCKTQCSSSARCWTIPMPRLSVRPGRSALVIVVLPQVSCTRLPTERRRDPKSMKSVGLPRARARRTCRTRRCSSTRRPAGPTRCWAAAALRARHRLRGGGGGKPGLPWDTLAH